ncbi:sugar-binding transcriptional regulator [Psychromarinibacter sp. C21-152]|uniref:Sugar-binding transcriptional regulator n=1 Tax=Psychromarinibacter sediminicola TaxID=3033385 RepID=A0AAE3NTE6_9RHOB|nr:sugar-binding transcriptional regulator [Psychromarinibacter sediminicola]MDF0602089.1 sugar-binding transcriptional regulator [Psychromarinibacter sediminicola]
MSRRVASADLSTDPRIDLAARAAWLSYEKARTQDQIAAELQVSRQVVQRLIALAHNSDLIEFRLKHALSDCIRLAEELRERYDLRSCEVAPTESGSTEDIPTVGAAGARYLELMMTPREPTVIGVGNGTTMREVSHRLRRMDRPNCRCVSLMGNLTRDGRASHHDVVIWISDRLNAECYPRPMPVVANTAAEREVLQAQHGFRSITDLVGKARFLLMGIGYWGDDASLLRDGFLTRDETQQAMNVGAVGEFLGYAIDAQGNIVDADYHARLTSFRPWPDQDRPVVIVASGVKRAPAIRAALTGRLANCLITDANTARLLLE